MNYFTLSNAVDFIYQNISNFITKAINHTTPPSCLRWGCVSEMCVPFCRPGKCVKNVATKKSQVKNENHTRDVGNVG